jgi:hypothetical protein
MTSLQIIGVGLGGTGTRSLQSALEDLGFGQGYDMIRASNHPEKYHLFQKLFEGNEDVLKELLHGCLSTLSYPGCMFYEKFMEWNPDAKCILTVMDNPDAWVKSAQETIFCANKKQSWLVWKIKRLIFSYMMAPYFYWVMKIMVKVHGVDPNDPNTDLTQMYTDWNNRIIETVPIEKLFIFNVKEGWKPLCDFLGVPVPDKPFPRVNSTEDWNRRVGAKLNTNLKLAGLKLLFLVVVLGLICSGLFFW